MNTRTVSVKSLKIVFASCLAAVLSVSGAIAVAQPNNSQTNSSQTNSSQINNSPASSSPARSVPSQPASVLTPDAEGPPPASSEPAAPDPRVAKATSLFGKKEVDPEKFIVLAAPRGRSNDYYLMIVEQLSGEKPCWKEHGKAPIEVDPLLMTFDYSGICTRNSDSNAYSIRMADRDLGLEYSLRVVKQGEDLTLMGYSNRDLTAPPIEIGRTFGISQTGFTRIVLNPEWRLTRRTYEQKPLGHIYLTSDGSVAGDAAERG